jgi:hypothetical protein
VSQVGHTVEFVVNQLWDESSVEMLAIHYHDSIDSQECDMREGVEGGTTSVTYEATCFDGFADVSIFVSVGPGFDAEACAACQAPTADSTDLVAYYFELPCTPICETLPEDVIKIVSQGGHTVDFVVNQLWDEISVEMLAIHYHDSIDSQDCDSTSPSN